MDLLYIILIVGASVCLFLLCCLCCLLNSPFCHCIDYKVTFSENDDVESVQPAKQSKEYSREYYSSPVLQTSSKEFSNGQKYTVLPPANSPNVPSFESTNNASGFQSTTDPSYNVSRTYNQTGSPRTENTFTSNSYSDSPTYSYNVTRSHSPAEYRHEVTYERNYKPDPKQKEASYSAKMTSYSESYSPYKSTTTTSYAQPTSYQIPSNSYLKRSGSQTSLYENS